MPRPTSRRGCLTPTGLSRPTRRSRRKSSTPTTRHFESTIPRQFNNNLDQNAMYGTGAPKHDLEPVADQPLRAGARRPDAVRGDRRHRLLVPVGVLGPELGAGNSMLNQGVPIVNYPAASRTSPSAARALQRRRHAAAARDRVPVALHRWRASFFIPEPVPAGHNRPCLRIWPATRTPPARPAGDPGRRRRVGRHRHELL